MALIWFVIWLIATASELASRSPSDPVNGWAATLLLAVALDLGASRARGGGSE